MTQPDRDGAWRPPQPQEPEEQQPLPPPPAIFPPSAVARAQVRPPQGPPPPGHQSPGQPFAPQHPGQQPFGAQPSAQQPYAQQGPAQQAFAPQAAVQQPFAPQASGPQQLGQPFAAQQQAQPQYAEQQQLAPVQPAPQIVPVQAATPVQQQAADATGRGLAAPQLTTAPLAGTQARALAAAQAAQMQENDTPPDEPSDSDAEARTGPSGKTSPLHIGWHAISRKTLRRVTVAPSAGAGLVLGRDRQHAPVPLHLFAPEPVRIALVGGVWAAQLLIFRAFALGARVVVVTTEPRAWAGFGERATGQYNRLTVHSSDQGVALTGSAQMPTLAVYDLGMTGPASTPPLGPWRTQLTILRQLDRPGLAALQESQLALLQRLGGDEAALAASALKLRPHSSQFLQFMADDMLALIGDGTDRYLFLAQTQTEQQFVGLPRR